MRRADGRVALRALRSRFSEMAMKSAAYALAILAGLGLLAGAAVPSRELKIGVVNLKDCFDRERNLRVRDARRAFGEFSAKLQDELNKVADEVKKKEEEIKLAPQGSELQLRLVQERAELAYRYKYVEELNKSRLFMENERVWTGIYNKLRTTIDDMAKKEGYDMILKVDEPLLEERQTDPVFQRINQRPVLYYNPAWDITAKLIDRLNNDYKAEPKIDGNPRPNK
jgi:Skp family chaperone for outer membrane proteins